MATKKKAEKQPDAIVRVPHALALRVDAYLEQMKARLPGVSLSRNDAMRTLLIQALDAAKIPPS